MKMKRQVALLVISAFLIGLLPMRDSTAIKAEFVSASAASPAPTEKITNSDYELKNPRTNTDDMMGLRVVRKLLARGYKRGRQSR